MPTIKAYSHKRNLVPVGSQIVTAYRCPWTDDVYETKEEYLDHLWCIRDMIQSRNIQSRLDVAFEPVRALTSWQDVIDWVHANSRLFFENAKLRARCDDDERINIDPKTFSIEILSLTLSHSNSVGNTHHCPIGGKTNWGGRTPGAPRGYPGWEGRISWRQSHELPTWGSDFMKPARILTGSGGGARPKVYGFDVRMFDADFPKMVEALNQENVEHILKGEAPIQPPAFSYGKDAYLSR